VKVSPYIFGILFLPIFVGCLRDSTVVLDPIEVDPQLVGVWYHIDSVAHAFPSPPVSFEGMEIGSDKTIRSAGIETATGKVALLEGPPMIKLLQANDGLLIIQYQYPPVFMTWSTHYRVEGRSLILDDWYPYVRNRTRLGFVVARPIQSTLSVMIDSVTCQSPRVSPAPPAYVSKISQSAIRLYADLPHRYMTVDIDSFVGPGTYSIGPNEGNLYEVADDYTFLLATDSLSTGTIVIEEYDEVSNRCSGRFEFVVHKIIGPQTELLKSLRNGTFSVPIYR